MYVEANRSALEAFIDAVQEFYKSLLQKIDHILLNEGKGIMVSIQLGFTLMETMRIILWTRQKIWSETKQICPFQKKIEVDTVDKAYLALTGKSVITFHNYFQENIKKHRQEVVDLLNTREEYDALKEENENFQEW